MMVRRTIVAGRDGPLAAFDAGEGDRVLLLVGGGPALSADYLHPLLALAGDDLRVVGFDPRGVGRSPLPALRRFGLADFADDVEAVRAAFKAKRPHFLVHSWGGYVLWEYLAAHPERVASLVLVAASAPDEHANHVATKRLVDRLARLRAAGYLGSTATLDGTARLLALAPAYFHDPLARIPEALLASESSLDVRAAVLAALAKEPRRDHAAAAAAFRGPALVIVGESDPLGVELAEANVACLARGRLALLESAGHFPWLEPVALERFLALVRSELTSRR